jgi:aminoglycoside phosphotransferase (APT) family kinase protein
MAEATVDAATPERLQAWIAAATGGEVVQFERGVVRREAYLATTRVDGQDVRYFVRVGRVGDVANSPEVAACEARLVGILARAGLPVARVVATDDELHAAIYSWVDGVPEVEQAPLELQQSLCEQYVDALAALHRLDHREIGVDWMHEPATAEECALAHADAIYDAMGSLALEPLSTFGIMWLRRHVPSNVARLSLLHGDAGIGNFLFVDGAMSGVIDWEWAHLGDPMEDLGSMCMHAGFHPAGDVPALLAHYERASGIAVDVAKVKYYCAHLYIRSVIALAAITEHLDPHNPVALNLAYRIVNDRLTCEAIADAMGIALDRPVFPDVPVGPTTLYDVVATNLRADVVPALTADFARNRAEMAAVLAEVLEREARIGPAVAAIERAELAELLGRRVTDVRAGLRALDSLIRNGDPAQEVPVLRYLYRRAVRTEELYAPVVALFPAMRIRPID